MFTVDESVVPEPVAPVPRRRRRLTALRRWWWAAPLVLVVAGPLVASLVPVPYYAIAPGDAIGVGGLVSVQEGPRYPPEGEVFLTTVSLRSASALDALRGWLDPDTDVVRREVVKPPEIDDDQLRDLNLDLMADSKELAVAVASEELGYDAVQGTGARVAQVVPDSPADEALRAGDTIVAVGGEPVAVGDEAARLLGERRPGDAVALEVEAEDGSRREVEVVLAANPDDEGRPFLGVSLATRALRLDLPFEVEIDSERIGGPSAGLAFTLEVLDVLTEGELTGGRRVATTGTIELDGSVGAVGGVRQKTRAVAAEGIELFLVPSSEAELARQAAGDDVRIAPVDDLDDALVALAGLGGNAGELDRRGGET